MKNNYNYPITFFYIPFQEEEHNSRPSFQITKISIKIENDKVLNIVDFNKAETFFSFRRVSNYVRYTEPQLTIT